MEIKEAIKWFEMLKEKFVNTEYETYLNLAISALEKQEQDRWIPVTERLPEQHKKVLVSYETLDDGKKVDVSMFDRYGCLMGIVEAWRPLPAPYQEDEV